MYLLDTNVVSKTLGKDPAYERLRQRVAEEIQNVYISPITIEEMLVDGVLPLVNTARSGKISPVKAYQFLEELIRDLYRFQILPYTDAAEAAYQGMDPKFKQHHPNDARIAASAQVNELTLVSFDSDFEEAGITVQRWGLLDYDEVAPPDWATGENYSWNE